MKRNENIAPLSRDHHFGLLFIWKLKEGIKKQIPAGRMGLYIHYFWEHLLKEHFAEEENFLFRQIDDPLCKRGLKEHVEIEQQIEQLESGNDNALHQIETFAEALEKHIRFEERELFPFIQTHLSETQLNSIGKSLASAHAQAPADDYPDHFWEEKKLS